MKLMIPILKRLLQQLVHRPVGCRDSTHRNHARGVLQLPRRDSDLGQLSGQGGDVARATGPSVLLAAEAEDQVISGG
jgi:predicted RNA-binding protein YlqC (UPF0109 family)